MNNSLENALSSACIEQTTSHQSSMSHYLSDKELAAESGGWLQWDVESVLQPWHLLTALD